MVGTQPINEPGWWSPTDGTKYEATLAIQARLQANATPKQ